MTLSDCLDLVPKYWPLEPGKDRWIEGDEEAIGDDSGQVDWVTARCVIGDWVLNPYVARRPIPEAVREAEAFLEFSANMREPQYDDEFIKLSDPVKSELQKSGRPIWRWVMENRK